MNIITAKMRPYPTYFLLPFLFCSLCVHAQTLAPQELVARTAAVQQALQIAEDKLAAAKSHHARIKQLLETNDATRAQLEAAEERLRTAERNLEELNAELAKIKTQEVPAGAPGTQEELTLEALTTRLISLDQELASAKSTMILAERNQAKAKDHFERAKALFDRHDATRVQLETAQERLNAAEQQLQNDRAEVARIEEQLAGTRAQLRNLKEAGANKH